MNGSTSLPVSRRPAYRSSPLGWTAIVLLLFICAVAIVAYGGTSRAASLDDRVQALASQLRCPVCQGETVADSNAQISIAIRRLIRKDLAAGESPDQIKAFLLARYPSISLAPSTSGLGQVAWLAPPLLVIGGAALLLTLVTDWRRRGRGTLDRADAAYLARVRAEVAAGEERDG
jgi:cytochrome c-type biogenesis protein CcmH